MSLVMKNALARMANADLVWPLFRRTRGLARKLSAFCDYVERQRATGMREDLKTRILQDRFPDLTVKNGPFAGLVYPGAGASGSALLPKLIGSYEDELHPVLTAAAARSYDDIIDVGCAEGYYAIGLARMHSKARILAYDVDAGARALCRRMAEANGVADRLELHGWCDAGTLAALDPERRALIVADCEGYEKELFPARIAPALARHDILIELHDYKDPQIGTSIRAALSGTHDIEEIPAIPDYRKAADARYPELDGYDAPCRRFIIEECRGAPQSWLFARARGEKTDAEPEKSPARAEAE